MKYPYMVVKDGVWYEAGQEVPASDISTPTTEIKQTVDENHHFSKTEIQRLSTSELQKLAEAEGIANALEKSGNQLKKILIEHFDL